MPELKLSDALFATAQSVIKFGENSGIKVTLTQVYNKDTVEQLAVISALMREMVEKISNEQITVKNE